MKDFDCLTEIPCDGDHRHQINFSVYRLLRPALYQLPSNQKHTTSFNENEFQHHEHQILSWFFWSYLNVTLPCICVSHISDGCLMVSRVIAACIFITNLQFVSTKFHVHSNTALLHFSKVDKGWMFPYLLIWICCSCITNRNTTGLVRKWLLVLNACI